MPQAIYPRRVALVTGGAKRVGRAIVERLAEADFDIAFTYFRSERDAIDLTTKLSKEGRCKCVRIEADLAQPQIFPETIRAVIDREFARLDLLVNNASLYEAAALGATSLELIRRLNAIHVESPLLLCQKLEPLLRASRGHIVNMVDLLAERPQPEYLAYCASKAALANLTLGLARALAPEVTVNAIAPGVVEWPADYPEESRQRYLHRVPLARAGSPEDVANLVHFLAAPESYITGQILRLDGGKSIA